MRACRRTSERPGPIPTARPSRPPISLTSRRPNALVLSALAILAAVAAVVVVALISGVSLHHVADDFRARWIVVVAIAEAVSFVPYMLAYRQMTVVAGLQPPNLSLIVTVVLSGFGPFVVG